MNSMRGNDDQRLDALFMEYRAACGSSDASANFMPNLWSKIEARQKATFSFAKMARGFATAAAGLALMLGLYMSMPQSSQVSYSQTYVEVLADANTPDLQDFVNPNNVELNRY